MFRGLVFILLAGAMNGSFATPMKRIRGWQWEHIWLVWSFLAMLVLPLAVAGVTVPDLTTVYCKAGFAALAKTAFLGAIWGIGTVLFGLGIARVGLALSFGIVLGTSSCLGAVTPLLIEHCDRVFTPAGLLLMAGVIAIAIGVAANARAGMLRESATRHSDSEDSFAVGLLLCLLSGVASSAMSLGLNVSSHITSIAESQSASATASLNAVWPVLLSGGFVVNAVYCIFLLIRNANVARYQEATGSNFGYALTMAVLWSGANLSYSTGAREMGSLGLVLGWPVYMALIVFTANVWGAVAGEWKSSGRPATTWAATGLMLLFAGIWIIAVARKLS